MSLSFPIYHSQDDGVSVYLTLKPSSPLSHPPLRRSPSMAFRSDMELMSSMNEWCINQHGKTGLTQACIDSPHTHEEVEESVRAYLEKWIPEAGAGLLAGSSVHADMRYVPLLPDVSHLPLFPLSSLTVSPRRTSHSLIVRLDSREGLLRSCSHYSFCSLFACGGLG